MLENAFSHCAAHMTMACAELPEPKKRGEECGGLLLFHHASQRDNKMKTVLLLGVICAFAGKT